MGKTAQPRLILSPCGSSILTYRCGDDLRRLFSRHANAKRMEDVPSEDAPVIRDHIDKRRREVSRLSINDISPLSAELNAIGKIYAGKLDDRNRDQHILICTDTWIGEEAAGIVKVWLERQGLTVQLDRKMGLQTVSPADFQLAMSELVRWCHETLPGYRENGYRIVFNLTGGFKAVIGFLQTLGMFYAHECVYIFESSGALLSLPSLSVESSDNAEVAKHLKEFRRLALGLPVGRDAIKNIPSTLWMEVGEERALSPWGELVWNRSREAIYESTLLDPVTPHVVFAEGFRESTADITGNRMAILNEKLDRLAVYIENRMERNDSSLDFKRLASDPCPPSTHEIDVWTGKGAKRIFGHFTDHRKRTFVVDRVDKHL